MFNLYDYEYKEVIDNTKNKERLSRAWAKVIDKSEADRLLKLLVAGEDIPVTVIWHTGMTAFANQKEHYTRRHGPVKREWSITLGEGRLSAGLIFHEFAHLLMFRESNKGHGLYFTYTLDMLLQKYEGDWNK